MDRGNSLIGAVIIFFLLLFVFAKWGPNIPVSILSQQKGEPLVVMGEGKVSVVPDIAKVSLGIEESGSSLTSLENSVNGKSKKLTDELKKLGIDEKDIKTTSYNVFPTYDFQNPNPKITGYRVSTSLEVKIKNFDKVNDAIIIATSNGANIVGGISFEVNDDTKKQKLQEARDMAVKEAKEKAQGLAKSAGITLGKIINITESQGQNPVPVPLIEKSGLGGAPTPAIPNIQPGETEIITSVSLSFEIR